VFALLMFTVSPAMRATPIFNAVLVIALLWWLVALAAVLTYPRNISMATAAGAGFATLLPAWGLLAFLHSSGPRGPSLVLTMLVIVWATDIGAFLAGRAFGRLKLAPRVSPNKTWEGLLGGILCAAAVGWAASGILGIAALQSASLAVATAMASVIGDLTVSMFKRNVGLKDSGHLLPGHGGLLDRIDSLTSAVAVFVLGLAVAGITT
jgi:phosphatidate cytidylyltransferase